MSGDLDSLTSELRQAYRQWKDGEEEKNRLKNIFFETLTENIDKESIATKIEYIDGVSFAEARDLALKRNPGWKFIGSDTHYDQGISRHAIGLEEDLQYKPAAHINRSDGYVYQRTVVEGPVLLDDEAIRDEDPDLWTTISRTRVIEEIVPFEEMAPETLEAIAKYLYRGAPTVKFLAPRKAREDELECPST